MELDKKPRVSIGLPVYNGENFLSAEIHSILNQTYSDFELIISDNASTDKTEEISRFFAHSDKRIKYVRNATNIGAAQNYNRTFHLSSGTYFKWAAHDDVLEPTYLERCVEILDKYPDVILCHTDVKIIDEKGQLVEYYINPLLRIDSQFPHIRFGDMILSHHPCFDIFGLIRADVLRKTKLHGNHLGADRNLLAELALRGRLFKYQDYLFNIRDHSLRSVRVEDQSPQSRAVWFDPTNTGKRMYEHPKYLKEYMLSIHRVSLSPSERFGAYKKLFKWAWREKLTMVNDVINNNPYIYRIYRVYAFMKYIGRKKPVHTSNKRPQDPVKAKDLSRAIKTH